MIIGIKIEERQVELILKDKKSVLDRIGFKGEYQLSERLLPEIDKLLKRNKLKKEDIKNIKSETTIGKSFTTYRIAKTVEKVFNFANKR